MAAALLVLGAALVAPMSSAAAASRATTPTTVTKVAKPATVLSAATPTKAPVLTHPCATTTCVMYDGNGGAAGNYDVYTKNVATGAVTLLTRDAAHTKYDSWWARPSPDGKRFLFYRTPAGLHDTDYTKTSLWVANIDGSGIREIVPNGGYGWQVQGHAEWSPDGKHLVMFGGGGPDGPGGIQITDVNGRSPRLVAQGIDPGWSPRGDKIVYVSCDDASRYPFCAPHEYRLYTADINVARTATSNVRRISTVQTNDPHWSPDGSKIAWESGGWFHWDLMVANADGSNQRVLFTDGQINTNPRWDESGKTLYFYKTDFWRYAGFGLWSIRADGTGLAHLTAGAPGYNEMPTAVPWQFAAATVRRPAPVKAGRP
jgi:Tol biopolymer transport system component